MKWTLDKSNRLKIDFSWRREYLDDYDLYELSKKSRTKRYDYYKPHCEEYKYTMTNRNDENQRLVIEKFASDSRQFLVVSHYNITNGIWLLISQNVYFTETSYEEVNGHDTAPMRDLDFSDPAWGYYPKD